MWQELVGYKCMDYFGEKIALCMILIFVFLTTNISSTDLSTHTFIVGTFGPQSFVPLISLQQCLISLLPCASCLPLHVRDKNCQVLWTEWETGGLQGQPPAPLSFLGHLSLPVTTSEVSFSDPQREAISTEIQEVTSSASRKCVSSSYADISSLCFIIMRDEKMIVSPMSSCHASAFEHIV